MKQMLILFFLCPGGTVFSQDTLYLPVFGLGSEEFVLYEDGSFVYSSHLCVFSYYSFVDYKKTVFGYKFSYDTTRCPDPIMVEVKSESPDDSLTLLFFDLSDRTSQPFFGKIVIGSQEFYCHNDSLKIAKSDLDSDTIFFPLIQKEFKFDVSGSILKFYLPSFGFGYECGEINLKKLRRTSRGYLDKSIVYDENEEKPWKKDRRVVWHYYELHKG